MKKTKRRVLIIVENLPVPFDSRVWKEACALHEHGYEVSVLCPRGKGFRNAYELLEGVHIYRHPMPKEGNSPLGYLFEYGCALFWEVLFAWWIFLARGFDVIQGCNPPDTIFLVAWTFRLFGVTYIFDHHDANPELYHSKYERKDFLYRAQVWLESLTYRTSSVVLATNSSYRDLALTRGRIAPEDVFVVRNGPDLETFHLVPSDPSLKYGRKFLVGYVGTMSIQEGLDILLDVADYLKTIGRTDVHFTCVGGGPGLAGLQQMVKEKNLADVVNFTGRVPDEYLLRVLSTADVCVNPDKPCAMNDISTMIKIMEYMALGKPIVQFDLKEGRFSAGGASLYARPENMVADFADKILWLLDHPEERRKMGEIGRARVEEQLAWKYSIVNLLDGYERAFQKRKKGSTSSKSAASQPRAANNSPAISKGSAPEKVLSDYYRLPEKYARVRLKQPDATATGYFKFGERAICFGEAADVQRVSNPESQLHDALADAEIGKGEVILGFNPTEVVGNLHRELYVDNWRKGSSAAVANLYYLFRPLLPVGIRRHLQSLYLRGWEKLPFPRWPVDCSVDNLLEELLRLIVVASGTDRVPFIWFWPDGQQSCAIMTHDVESRLGCRFCPDLMDVDDAFGIKASFQIIPEDRYLVRPEFLSSIRDRGFEIAIHDLNHDGHLYRDRNQFLERAAKINSYGIEFGAAGFRSAVLYRKQVWYDALKFAFDMSVPNVAHLDPQRGGCCTVMPYFLDEILEIPVTTVQDYTLFNVLHDYSVNLWKEQMEIIMRKNGCMSFIVHPDYVTTPQELGIYKQLLGYLSEVRENERVWVTTPSQVNQWWRQRAAMTLVEDSDGWHIEGEGSERARIAFARQENGRLIVSQQNIEKEDLALRLRARQPESLFDGAEIAR
jgi:glycosyltransferase involved in cell wall biosynthesis